MSDFSLFFKLGVQHILDIHGLDHILFVIVLCAVYLSGDWKKVLILITAFTIGHSITLALATFKVISVNGDLVEFLIPMTIAVTAVSNIFRKNPHLSIRKISINYFYALFFGLIHGLGFAKDLQALLGRDSSIVRQLLAFNLGLEIGQIVVVVIFITISSILIGLFSVSRREWNLFISSMSLGIALMMMMEARFW